MADAKPLVSIGMPVYNGERFIRQALDSLLMQDYEHFELIISDNASTDRTQQICQQYLACDERVWYFRNETNLGSIRNFNRAFELSTGTYFMWASDHDLWHPTCVSRCVAVLQEAPDAVLAYPRAVAIDCDGNRMYPAPDASDTRDMSTYGRYTTLLSELPWCIATYGVMRAEALAATGRFRQLVSPECHLLAELALKGAFAHVPDELFYLRRNRPDEKWGTAAYKHRVLCTLDPVNAPEWGRKSFHRLRLEVAAQQLKLVARATMSPAEKLLATAATVFYFRPRRIRLRRRAVRFVKRLAKQLAARCVGRTAADEHRPASG